MNSHRQIAIVAFVIGAEWSDQLINHFADKQPQTDCHR